MLGEILILVGVMLLNAFFAASEMAIVSAKRPRLQKRVDEENHRGAILALQLAEDSGRFLSSVQIGITILSVFAGAYGGATFAEPLATYFEPLTGSEHATEWAFTTVVGVITYVSLVIGELVPKRLAIANAEAVAVIVAWPMNAFALLTAPLIWLLQTSSNAILYLLPARQSDDGVTEEEIKTMIAEGGESGTLAPVEQQMLEGVLRMGDRSVRALMTPRQDVVWLDLNEPLAGQIEKFVGLGYSRMPAARGDLNEIAGIAYARDVLGAYASGVTLVAPPLREPLTVHDGMSVLKLIELFRATGRHMAVVVDEHGSVEGVVTTTDVLEAVTGVLTTAADPDDHEYVKREDGSWLVGGMVPIDEAMARLGLRNPKDAGEETAEFHTLAGFVLKMLGHLPKAGARFIWESHTFEVVDMDGRRVDKVLVIPPAAKED